MKKLLSLTFLFVFVFQTKAQTPTVTLVNSYSLTPNTTDTIGAFARIYYHSPRNKFYSIYAARPAGSTAPSGQLSNYAWREYDINMNFTGNKGTLSGQTSSGDFACVMVDSTYYHLTALGSTTSGILKYKLTKYDDDFTSLASKTITLLSHDNNIDQLMNYANGRLIIGAMHDSSASPPVTPPAINYDPYINIYQYDLNLNSLAPSKLLSQKAYSWGGSCIFDNGSSSYYVIADKTTSQFNIASLYAYKYDINFNYISTTTLSSNGQWPQGVVWDGQYYYLAYHTGAHNHGNLLLGIFNASWVNVSTSTITSYPVLTTTSSVSYNANRPFITKVGNTLYVSFDVEKYIFPVNQKDWQARVNVYQINGVSGLQENKKNSSILIYPNPTKESFSIKTSQIGVEEKILFYNMLGELVYETSFTNEISINSKNWEKGVYFYQTKNNFIKGKIIIQ